MQPDTPDILFSLFKMTFNLRGSSNQELSCIVKIEKKHFFRQKFWKQLTFSDSVQSHD
jgi:hypothetical protein